MPPVVILLGDLLQLHTKAHRVRFHMPQIPDPKLAKNKNAWEFLNYDDLEL